MDWAGPLWTGNLWNLDFVEQMIKENRTVAFKNSARITKLLTLIKDETQLPATYYIVDKLSGKLGLPSVSIQAYIKNLLSGGFQAALTHFNPRGIRTNASAMDMKNNLQKTVQPPS
jgi:tRNA (guanine26-N2/guanine27-N2)-dimethyltransferase